MKKFLLLIIQLILVFHVFGQNGFVVTDTSLFVGENVVDKGAILNSQYCYIQHYDTSFKYSPEDILAYGIKGGPKYVVKEIKMDGRTQKVFLEVLIEDHISLYLINDKGNKRYFVGQDSLPFFEIYKESNSSKLDFNDSLALLMNHCDQVISYHHLVNFKKASLSRFFKNYHSCSNRPFPRFRFGAYVGFNIYHFIEKQEDEYLKKLEFTSFTGFSYNVFLDQPITASDFSFRVELSYSKKAYSKTGRLMQAESDFVTNINSINLPVLFRYTFPTVKFRPYINLGGIFNYNFRNEVFASYYNYDGDDVFLTLSDTEYIPKYQLGYAIGGGLEYTLTPKYSIFCEFRYNELLSLENGSLGLRYISINLGFSL